MAASGLVVKVGTWLSSTWHVKVPAPWLEACIDWIQQENGSGSLSLASVNKQVFEQWLLTDLRDLEYPVLPDCILSEPKGEVNGFYSIQIDSLVDVSQPAYSQLQRIRGKNTVNEEITANPQGFLRSWEAKPTRMLMLQLTDGIHHIQGMEYHPIPVLNSSLLPGTKIMIKGKVAYRLGVLLLKSENVKLLGGEVDSLVEEYSEEKVLARLIGEESDNQHNIIRSNIGESGMVMPVDELGQALGPSDEELLASLGESNELMINEMPTESGYCSQSASLISTTHYHPPISGEGLQQGSATFTGEHEEQSISIMENMEEDFDDFPLDNLLLEEEIQQQPILSRSTSINNQLIRKSGERGMCNIFKENKEGFSVNHNVQHTQNLDSRLRNKVMEERINKSIRELSSTSSTITGSNKKLDQYSDYAQISCLKNKCHKVSLDTLPFTYLSVLLGNEPKEITIVKVKAFIVTLTGNLTNNNDLWSVTAKISDGTAYLDVNFADEILTSLIGFSVPEMKQMRKDPILSLKLKEGLQNCQRELIDLCCVMTVEFNPFLPKATVIVLQDVNANDVNSLKTRLNLNAFDPSAVVVLD